MIDKNCAYGNIALVIAIPLESCHRTQKETKIRQAPTHIHEQYRTQYCSSMPLIVIFSGLVSGFLFFVICISNCRACSTFFPYAAHYTYFHVVYCVFERMESSPIPWEAKNKRIIVALEPIRSNYFRKFGAVQCNAARNPASANLQMLAYCQYRCHCLSK